MKKYKVVIKYMYSDTLEIEAENEEDAEIEALEECEEQCEILHEIKITEIK